MRARTHACSGRCLCLRCDMSSCVSCSLWRSLSAAIQSAGPADGRQEQNTIMKKESHRKRARREKEIGNAADGVIV